VIELLLPLRILSSLLAANRFPSRINLQAVAAQINSPLAIWTKHLIISSPGQAASRERSCLITPRLYSRKIKMSWSIIDGDILWSTKSRCSVSGMWQNSYRIAISGLLVRKTRSRTFSNNRASAESCRIIRISLSSLHSSSASTTRTYEARQPLPSSFESGPRTSSCHWSRRDRLVISLCSVIASQMNR
jgi:hypothetical protein